MIETYKGDIYAVLTAIAWSVAVVFYKHSGRVLAPVPLKTFHNVIAVILFAVSIILIREPFALHMSGEHWLRLIASAFIGISLADTLYVAAINRVGAGVQALVDGLYTPFIIILAFLFWHEHLPTMTLWGGALVVGATVIAHLDVSRIGVDRKNLFVGLTYAVLSQFAMAACVLLIRDILKEHSVLTITFYRYIVGTIFLVLITAPKFPWKIAVRSFKPSKDWRVLLPGVILGPYTATLFWFAGFKYTLAGRAAIYNQLSTIFIILLAAMFLNERLTALRILAVVLGVLGSFLVLMSPLYS